MRIYVKWTKVLNIFLGYRRIREKRKTKNVYNLWVEFLNKMKNVKAIKEKID